MGSSLSCQKCGMSNLTADRYCARCGHLLPAGNSSSKTILVVLAVIGGLWVLGSISKSTHQPETSNTSTAASPSPASRSEQTIHSSAELTTLGLVITNKDSFVYSNPDIIIHNGGTFSGGYETSSRDIPPHKSITVPWSSFTMTDGTRFNYFREKPTMITMEVTANGSHAYAGWRF